jgi:recombination protein RecT
MAKQEISTSNQNALGALREDLGRMAPQFKYALPAHIPVERFMRVVMTAVQNNPTLLRTTRQSFFNACMRCAQDGLLPDGREAVIVPFDAESASSETASYMPMIGGWRKKVRNSGLLRDWNVQVVQEGDAFEYELGDRPFIHHKPAATGGRTRPVLFAYSIATYPDGTLSREVMNIDQIRDIQKLSKAKRGPWSNPVFFPEMCRKTVAKLHAKQLPMSTDLDTLLRRDDELYDFAAAKAARPDEKPPPSVTAALDAFGSMGEEDASAELSQQDSARTDDPRAGDTGGGSEDQPQPTSTAQADSPSDPLQAAYERGRQARGAKVMRKAVPPEYRAEERAAEAEAWLRGWDETEKTLV